jgi:hypothetical protein
MKKKQRTVNLERSVADLTGRAEELSREAADLRRENGWLKEIIVMRGRTLQRSSVPGDPYFLPPPGIQEQRQAVASTSAVATRSTSSGDKDNAGSESESEEEDKVGEGSSEANTSRSPSNTRRSTSKRSKGKGKSKESF